jgi:hypothetical protein
MILIVTVWRWCIRAPTLPQSVEAQQVDNAYTGEEEVGDRSATHAARKTRGTARNSPKRLAYTRLFSGRRGSASSAIAAGYCPNYDTQVSQLGHCSAN